MLNPVFEFTHSPLGIQVGFALTIQENMFAVFLFSYVLTFGVAGR